MALYNSCREAGEEGGKIKALILPHIFAFVLDQ
jgi:hypothetical protein